MPAIILSITRKERHDPGLIDASRQLRIAKGAGCEPQDVSGLVKQFNQMGEMMKSIAGAMMQGKQCGSTTQVRKRVSELRAKSLYVERL